MGEVTNTSDCAAKYKPDGSKSLQEILDEIFAPGMIPLIESSRGFVDPTKFEFKTDQQKEASISISNCDGKRIMSIENLKTDTLISPVSNFISHYAFLILFLFIKF